MAPNKVQLHPNPALALPVYPQNVFQFAHLRKSSHAGSTSSEISSTLNYVDKLLPKPSFTDKNIPGSAHGNKLNN